jgi:hypothetical protein
MHMESSEIRIINSNNCASQLYSLALSSVYDLSLLYLIDMYLFKGW